MRITTKVSRNPSGLAIIRNASCKESITPQSICHRPPRGSHFELFQSRKIVVQVNSRSSKVTE